MDRDVLKSNLAVENNSEISLTFTQFQLFPTESVGEDKEVLAATLGRKENEYKLTVYRYDPNDPLDERINFDEYIAWAGLPSHLPRDEMINAVDTDDDPNFQDYENNSVFIKFRKKSRYKSHHLSDLPRYVNPFEK